MKKPITTENFPRCAVRWPSPSPSKLRELVNVLANKRGGSRWSQYFFDGRETSADEPDAVLNLRLLKLTPLSHFRICHNNEQVWRVTLSSHQAYSDAWVWPIAEWCGRRALSGIQQIYLTFYLADPAGGEDRIESRFGDFTVAIRGRMVGDRPHTTIEFGQFDGSIGLDRRFDFFKETLNALKLNSAAQVAMEDGLLYVRGTPPWNITFSGTGRNQSNPCEVCLAPFVNFSDAWTRVSESLETSPAKPINVSLSVNLTPPAYEALREEFNSLASDWEVVFYGGYADGIDPYVAAASQSPDGRFPIMSWGPSAGDGSLFYQADIIPTSDGRWLEIHSNCGDMKKLLKEVESATGQKFVAVASD